MAFTFQRGSLPLLISIPHNGSQIPDGIAESMTADGKSSRDTDWFLDQLYDLPELADASRIVAEYSRYVIDLNRPRDNQSLYPGQTTTGLIPETCFDGSVVYKAGSQPNAAEVERRIETIWQPYHDQIDTELQRMRNENGIAVLIEAHSIASEVPRLFEGVLPDFNIGTNQGQSCCNSMTEAVMSVLKGQSNYSHVLNGRFVGGYITRYFGRPDEQIHAIQIELSQKTYLNESDLSWNDESAVRVQKVFGDVMAAITNWIKSSG